jgi:hypothetical protein
MAVGDQGAEQTTGGDGAKQQPVTGSGQPDSRVWADGVQHENSEGGVGCEVVQPGDAGECAQEPVAPQEPQPLGNVGSDRGALRALHPELAADEQQRGDSHGPQRRGHRERHGDSDANQNAAQRWSDELVGRQLGSLQAGVGAREVLAGHGLGQDRLRAGVVDGLGSPQEHGHAVQRPDRAVPEQDRRGQYDKGRYPDQVGDQHR